MKRAPARAANSSQPTASASFPSIPTSLRSETVCHGEEMAHKTSLPESKKTHLRLLHEADLRVLCSCICYIQFFGLLLASKRGKEKLLIVMKSLDVSVFSASAVF